MTNDSSSTAQNRIAEPQPTAVRDHPSRLGDLETIFRDLMIGFGIDRNGQVILARPDRVLTDGARSRERRTKIADVVRQFDEKQADEIATREISDELVDIIPVRVEARKIGPREPDKSEREDRWSLQPVDDVLGLFARADVYAELDYVVLGSPSFIGHPLGAPASWAGEIAFPGTTEKVSDGRTVMLTTAEPTTPPPFIRPRINIEGRRRPRVLILDTGIRTDGHGKPEHKDLAACELQLYFQASEDKKIIDDEDEIDEDDSRTLDFESGHGTFITGIVRQMCPDADIYTAGVLSSFGAGPVSGVLDRLSRVLKALETKDRIDIVVMSFGAFFADDEPGLFGEALTALVGDRLCVAAAGNEMTCRPNFPAALPDVIAVGGLAADGKAWFTNFGGWVGACAPAIDVVSTFFTNVTEQVDGKEYRRFEGWARWSGTSFSAPKVAAQIAQEMYLNGGTAKQAWKRMISHKHFRYPDLGIVFNV